MLALTSLLQSTTAASLTVTCLVSHTPLILQQFFVNNRTTCSLHRKALASVPDVTYMISLSSVLIKHKPNSVHFILYFMLSSCWLCLLFSMASHQSLLFHSTLLLLKNLCLKEVMPPSVLANHNHQLAQPKIIKQKKPQLRNCFDRVGLWGCL